MAYGEEKVKYAVNLLDRTESAITPSESLEMGRTRVESERGRVRQNRELWWWLVLAGLVVLTLEWMIYSRRAWI